jgi:BirA family biotin operon repressor/biotin-[acetyl-CoA-carboxylase] ligase
MRPSEPLAVAPGQRLLHLAETVSTMEEAAALVRAGDLGPVWIVADRQTGGRGRLGRSWVSPPGNLHATLLIPAPVPPADLPKLGFAAGVALAEAIDDTLAMPGAARLKWPNDVLLDGAKASGLLLEGHAGGRAVAVGIGVNVAHAPAGLPYPTRCLKDLNQDASRRILLLNLSEQAIRAIQLFAREGFQPVREAWLARAAHLGRIVSVNRPEEMLSGMMAGLDGEGRLLLDHEGVRHTVTVGDVA